MNRQFSCRRAACGAILLAVLSACGGGSGGGSVAAPVTPVPPVEAPRYLLGGTVTGLSAGASVVLANGADKVTVSANGAFGFPVKLLAGTAYEGKVESASPGIGCSISNGAATVGNADVGTLAVRCLPVVLAGVQEQIQHVDGMVQDTAGNFYIADSLIGVIHKVARDGSVSIHAGTPGKVGADDGAASGATFSLYGTTLLAIDREDNVYVADNCNALLRKITPAGVVSTVAGRRRAACAYATSSPHDAGAYPDGQGQQAEFGMIESMAFDRNGDLLLADSGQVAIRKVTAAGTVSTPKLSFFVTPGLTPVRMSVSKIAVDAAGTVYFSNKPGSHIFRLVNGLATSVAGSAVIRGYDGKGDGASFAPIHGLAFERSGNLLVADRSALRRVTPDGDVSTVVGRQVPDSKGSYADWTSLSALLLEPSGDAMVYDFNQHRLSKIDTAGVLSTVPFLPGHVGPVDGVGATARLAKLSPSGMCADPSGNVYLLDKPAKVIRKVGLDGAFSIYAGIANVAGNNDGPRQSAKLFSPLAIACDSTGAVYVADTVPAEARYVLRKVGADGMVSNAGTLPGLFLNGGQHVLSIDKDGYIVWSVTLDDIIYRRAPGGAFTEFLSFNAVRLALGDKNVDDLIMQPYSMVFDSKGNMYFDDYSHQLIFKVDRAGVFTVFAGTLYSMIDKDGAQGVGSLSFSGIPGLAIDASDNLYVGGQGLVRKVNPAGVISTPQLAWGKPTVGNLSFANGTLFGYTAQAIVQTPVP